MRPFYRWKSFWLGLCVLAFLVWAWGRSMVWSEGVGWQQRGAVGASGRAMAVMQAMGQVYVVWGSYDPFGRDGLSFWREPMGIYYDMRSSSGDGEDPFADPSAVKGGDEVDPFAEDGAGSSGVPLDAYGTYAMVVESGRLFPQAIRVEGALAGVAHWVVVLGVLCAWVPWLVWHWRRERGRVGAR